MKNSIKSAFIFLFVFIILTSTGCSKPQSFTPKHTFEDGIELAYEDVFWNLWYATSDVNIIDGDERIFETDYFIVETWIDNRGNEGMKEKTGDERYLHVNLITKKDTIKECFYEDAMFFNVYASSNKMLSPVFNGDLYIMTAELEYVSEYEAHATAGIYDDVDSVLYIFAIDGKLFRLQLKM